MPSYIYISFTGRNESSDSMTFGEKETSVILHLDSHRFSKPGWEFSFADNPNLQATVFSNLKTKTQESAVS